MTSPRLVLHPPSVQASQTALLPAVTPLRNLLKTAGQHTKESLSRFNSSVGSGLETSSLLVSLVALFPCRTLVSLHTILLFVAVFLMHLIWKPASAHQVPFPASWFANDQLLALQLFHTARLLQLRVGWGVGRWVFPQRVYQTMRFRQRCAGSFAVTRLNTWNRSRGCFQRPPALLLPLYPFAVTT